MAAASKTKHLHSHILPGKVEATERIREVLTGVSNAVISVKGDLSHRRRDEERDTILERPTLKTIEAGLHFAARLGLRDDILSLLQDGHDPDPKDTFIRTPLSYAAENGYVAVVELLLQNGAKMESKDKNYNRTPLLWASGSGHEAVVKLLIDNGAGIDSRDSNNRTPLSRAAENGHEAVVKLLLANIDVKVNQRDYDGQTPLYLAAKNGHEAVVKLLLANVDIRVNLHNYENGQTLLSSAAKNGHEAVVKLLLANVGIEVNLQKYRNGQTPLSSAAENGHEAVVKLLLANVDIKVNLRDYKNGQTPLSSAAENGHEAVVKLLLANVGIKVNLQDYDGRTPLSYAVIRGHESVVRVLLSHDGVDRNNKDKHGEDLLVLAVANKHPVIFDLLFAINNKSLNRNDNDTQSSLQYRSEMVKSFASTSGKNILKHADSDVDNMQNTTSFLHLVDKTVRGACRIVTDTTVYRATIYLAWQLEQCIRIELDGSPDLSPILTISGNSSHAWAVSCLEYVEATWHEVGRQFLGELETILGKVPAKNTSDGPHTPLKRKIRYIDDDIRFSRILFKGSISEMSVLAQFLCWIAATFRVPQVGELSCSLVNFESVPNQCSQTPSFRISLRELFPLDERNPSTCWKSLLPTTIIALDFPVPEYPGIFGLRIPFGAMLEMANILYDVNLEDGDENDAGIYFEGVFWALYPTAYIEDTKTIQWHLVRKPAGEEQNQIFSSDDVSTLKWVRIRDLETLSSAIAVLGYCNEAHIQLGTEAQREQHRLYKFSSTNIENPPPDASVDTASLGFSALGFVTGQFAAAFKARKGLRDAQVSEKEMSYTEMLDRTEVEPVILFETEEGNERAWMVPQLCVILDLFNFWASRKGLDNIRYARRGPDGGAEARAILADVEYVNRVAIPKILHTESDVLIGDVVKQIYGRMRKRMATNAESDDGLRGNTRLGRVGMVGWDWLELTNLAWTITRRREARPSKQFLPATKPCWMPLTKVVPIFFGQQMGELITPARPSEVCRHWHPIPGGFENNYLAASIRCIKALAAYFGQDRCWFLPENLVWNYKDESMFHPCVGCITDPKACVKRPQTLVSAGNRLRRKCLDRNFALMQVSKDGAVVFAIKRKDERMLDTTRRREDCQQVELIDQQPVVMVKQPVVIVQQPVVVVQQPAMVIQLPARRTQLPVTVVVEQ